MVAVPATPQFRFKVSGVEIEGGEDLGDMDVQFPWEPSARKQHDHNMTVPRFFIDTYPVTCEEYAAFLAQSGYHHISKIALLC